MCNGGAQDDAYVGGVTGCRKEPRTDSALIVTRNRTRKCPRSVALPVDLFKEVDSIFFCPRLMRSAIKDARPELLMMGRDLSGPAEDL
jgi:hypothetical protein